IEEPIFRSCTFDVPEKKKGTFRHRLPSDGGALVVVAKLDDKGQKSLVHLEYDDTAWFQAQTAKRVEKRIIVKDQDGKAVTFAIAWEKVKGEKRNSGYRADTVDVLPAKRPPKGKAEAYRFLTRSGATVIMTLSFGGA
ncbi:hypothetical protein HQ560_17445, partial [bacterium]|nr:hypothetical protein [bacterium]